MAQQYSIRKGSKLFGEDGRKATKKELMQSHSMSTYTLLHAHELTQKLRMQALLLQMLLMQNWEGRIKGRTCTNRSKQREYIDKESATLLTALTHSLMMMAKIDATESQMW